MTLCADSQLQSGLQSQTKYRGGGGNINQSYAVERRNIQMVSYAQT